MQTIHFTVSVNCNISALNGTTEEYQDNGFIILPDCYTQNGKPTRLVINCHGAGGTVTTNDSQVEHQILTQYLVANGYAVMDVNGLPFEYADKNEIDLRNNIGSQIAVESYIKAYYYCIKNYNLHREVFVHGGSMGGISSTNLVLSEVIMVIVSRNSAIQHYFDTKSMIWKQIFDENLTIPISMNIAHN